MPVILRIRGYKIWFYEADLDEPPHVHVGKSGKEAKFWMEPVRLARAGRFREQEVNEIERILVENESMIIEVWRREQSKRDC